MNICCICRPSVALKERTIYLRLTGRLCTTWGWFTSQQNSMHLHFITSQRQSTWILHVQKPSCCWLVSLESLSESEVWLPWHCIHKYRRLSYNMRLFLMKASLGMVDCEIGSLMRGNMLCQKWKTRHFLCNLLTILKNVTAYKVLHYWKILLLCGMLFDLMISISIKVHLCHHRMTVCVIQFSIF